MSRPTSIDISEVMWQEAQDYGVRLTVDEQVAIARLIRRQARDIPTSVSINAAFRAVGLHAPRGYAIAVRNRLARLFPDDEAER